MNKEQKATKPQVVDLLGEQPALWLGRRGVHGSYADLFLKIRPEEDILVLTVRLAMARALTAMYISKHRRKITLDEVRGEDKGTVINELRRELQIAYTDLFPHLGAGIAATFHWLIHSPEGLTESALWTNGVLNVRVIEGRGGVQLPWLGPEETITITPEWVIDQYAAAQSMALDYALDEEHQPI